jgi:hypothetical protein
MDFAGFKKSCTDKINGWHLPERIVNKLKSALDDVADLSPDDLKADFDGLFFPISVVDCDHPGHCYFFSLRIGRNDLDRYYIVDIQGFGVDGDGEVIWSDEA